MKVFIDIVIYTVYSFDKEIEKMKLLVLFVVLIVFIIYFYRSERTKAGQRELIEQYKGVVNGCMDMLDNLNIEDDALDFLEVVPRDVGTIDEMNFLNVFENNSIDNYK